LIGSSDGLRIEVPSCVVDARPVCIGISPDSARSNARVRCQSQFGCNHALRFGGLFKLFENNHAVLVFTLRQECHAWVLISGGKYAPILSNNLPASRADLTPS